MNIKQYAGVDGKVAMLEPDGKTVTRKWPIDARQALAEGKGYKLVPAEAPAPAVGLAPAAVPDSLPTPSGALQRGAPPKSSTRSLGHPPARTPGQQGPASPTVGTPAPASTPAPAPGKDADDDL